MSVTLFNQKTAAIGKIYIHLQLVLCNVDHLPKFRVPCPDKSYFTYTYTLVDYNCVVKKRQSVARNENFNLIF